MVQCKATMRSGEPCTKSAVKNNKYDGYCSNHKKLYISKLGSSDAMSLSSGSDSGSEVTTSISISDDSVDEQQTSDLFNHLFDVESGYIKEGNLLFLKNCTFNETFDYNKLAFILTNISEIEKLYRDDARNQVSLDKYFASSVIYNKKAKTGILECKYYQNDNGLYGRYQAKGALSAQGMVREVRHTIFNDFYYDIDIDNAHPVITRWLCDNLKIDCQCLSTYINNRESIFRDLIELNPSKNREHFKKAFLKVSYGCGDKAFDSLFDIKTPFVEDFRKEIISIQNNISKIFSQFYKLNKANRDANNKKYNYKGSTLSHICQFVENQLLMMIYNLLEKEVGNDIKNSILCFDGIMIDKKLYNPSFLDEIEFMFKSNGIDIKLSVKQMKSINLGEMGYTANRTYKYKPIMDYSSNDLFNQYPQMFSILTDVDAAVMFVKKFDNFMIFDGKVYMFNGVYWKSSNQRDIINSFKIICTDFNNKLGYSDILPETLKTINANLLKLKTICALNSIYGAIKNIIEVSYNILDNNPNLIGFENGVYDLSVGKFRKGCKEDFISLSSGYDYDDAADVSEISDWLDRVMPWESERNLLLRTLSSGLFGKSVPYFTILVGQGRNGKDTLMTYFIKEALGDYYYRANNSAITDDVKGDLNVSIASMHKKRCVVFNEPSKLKTVKTSMVKELTGCKNIAFRMPYSTNTEIDLSCSMFMLCNDKPLLDAVDGAIASRLLIIPFRSQFRTEQYAADNGLEFGEDRLIYRCDTKYQDDSFINTIKMPLMKLLLESFKQFKDDGYQITDIPDSIKSLSHKYLTESDPFTSWFNEKWIKTGDHKDFIKLKDVYECYKGDYLYENLTKADKRRNNYKWFTEHINNHHTLKLFYKKRAKINGADLYSILAGYRPVTSADCEEGEYDEGE